MHVSRLTSLRQTPRPHEIEQRLPPGPTIDVTTRPAPTIPLNAARAVDMPGRWWPWS
jgi:hypothetical protein